MVLVFLYTSDLVIPHAFNCHWLIAIRNNSTKTWSCSTSFSVVQNHVPKKQQINQELNPQIQNHPVINFWESQWETIEKLTIIAVERDWEDYLEQFCLSLQAIFSSSDQFAIRSQLLIKSLNLLGKAAEHKPFVHYYGIVRTV